LFKGFFNFWRKYLTGLFLNRTVYFFEFFILIIVKVVLIDFTTAVGVVFAVTVMGWTLGGSSGRYF